MVTRSESFFCWSSILFSIWIEFNEFTEFTESSFLGISKVVILNMASRVSSFLMVCTDDVSNGIEDISDVAMDPGVSCT